MKRLISACLLVLATLVSGFAVAEEKLALVIGNSNYQHIGQLKNPVNDARTVAQTLRLRNLGFKVTELHNRNRRQMARAISQFGSRIKPSSVVLVYFAGHGGQYQGENYLFPVDFNAQTEKELSIDAVSTKFIMDHLKSNTNGLNILILDACRNNPLTTDGRFSSRGLTRIDNAPPNTYSIYATSPGKVANDNPHGANGLFTQHLVKYMKQPGLDLGDMVLETRKDVMKASGNKQVPYDYGTLTRKFCLAGCEAKGNQIAASPVTPPAIAQQAQRRPQPATSNQHSHGSRSHAHPLPAEGLNHQHGQKEVKSVQEQTQRPPTTASSKRYRVNGDGTVSDSKTGLMWMQCSEGLSGTSCQNGRAKNYRWQKALGFKGSRFAGYNDWRLPTIEELLSVVYCSNGTPAKGASSSGCQGKNNRYGDFQQPTIFSAVFPNTRSNRYWSSSRSASNSSKAWDVSFYSGYDSSSYQSNTGHVRLVRVGQ